MTIADRLAKLDWEPIEQSPAGGGYARTPPMLTADECGTRTALYSEESRFRSRGDMARYRFGIGDYKYFAPPLPPVVADLRAHAYPPLARIANRWEKSLGARRRYPDDLPGLLAICRRAGQTKPTPLLLHYETGGYNCLHQDLYRDVAFPPQITPLLRRPGVAHQGRE